MMITRGFMLRREPTPFALSQMQFSQGQTVKRPRFIAGGVSALG